MKPTIILKGFSSTVVIIALLLSCLSSLAQEKKKRIYRTKEATDNFLTEKYSLVRIDSFIVKFAEGTRIRQRGEKFVTLSNSIKTKDISLLKDNQLSLAGLQKELLKLNEILKGFKNIMVKRYFERTEQEIDKEQDTLENKVNEELADLNLYYLIVFRSGNAMPLITALNSLKIVENAYPVYKIENAIFRTNITGHNKTGSNNTGEFSDRQEYLNAAPRGINAKYAWTIKGGKGEAIKIIDVESQWDIRHEDIKAPFWISSALDNSNGEPGGDHGTAVLGEMIAVHNNFGIKGISPAAAYGISGVSVLGTHTGAVSAAIDNATVRLKEGDIILIEQHTPGPGTGEIDSTCNPSQFEYVPMEFYQDCFDAIRRATAKGIIVVEAAGNGGVNLDAPLYMKLFNKNVRDSKAIMVSADEGGNGIASCWANYGSRIDFFGWGNNIITTGYGDFPATSIDAHKKYTELFAGTSGASPIIVGAIACVQGIRKKMGLKVWTSDLIRKNLIGTPQAPGDKFIGIMPDLKATIERMKMPKSK